MKTDDAAGVVSMQIPLQLSELLHATLGPLCEVLEDEGHSWAPIVRIVLTEYATGRNRFMRETYGPVEPYISHATFLASERVCDLTQVAIKLEEHFRSWSAEIDGTI